MIQWRRNIICNVKSRERACFEHSSKKPPYHAILVVLRVENETLFYVIPLRLQNQVCLRMNEMLLIQQVYRNCRVIFLS